MAAIVTAGAQDDLACHSDYSFYYKLMPVSAVYIRLVDASNFNLGSDARDIIPLRTGSHGRCGNADNTIHVCTAWALIMR
jgi:hypothetical protein